MSDPFDGPSSTSAKITNYLGALLLITPTAYEDSLTTAFTKPGETTDAVRADLVVLDEPKDGFPEDEEAPHEVSDILIFQGVLIGQTKAKVGKGMVLGRLIQRDPSRPGVNGAFALEDPTDADKEVAREYLKTKEPFA